MATVEQFIRNNPNHPINTTGTHQQIVTDIFNSFCDQAKRAWSYAASSPGIDVNLILASDDAQPWGFNCGRLTGLFVEVVRKYFVDVLHVSPFPLAISNRDCDPRHFVTRPGLTCFDGHVVGNVCTVRRSVADVRRCLFSEHWFVRIGTTYYDPTFCTTYTTANGVVGCQLDGGPRQFHTRGSKMRTLVKILSFGGEKSEGKFYTGTEDSVRYVFLRTGDASFGFTETFRKIARGDLTGDDKTRMGLT
ncbi:MAG: hypothetical protein FJ290_16600 [Planctomycetes bacterium]|nr:hypothetical protein [Planctomycetota bacterium]